MGFLGKIMCFDRVNEILNKLRHTTNFDFVDSVIDDVGLNVTYQNTEKIPTQGRLLVVANHPLGGTDWLILLQCLSNVRKDIKVAINNDVNTLIRNTRDLFIPVDMHAKSNEKAREQIGENLKKEEAILLFPSGAISVLTRKGIRDRKWKNGIAHFSKEHKTDVLPIFIRGRFSWRFYFYPKVVRRFLLIRNLLYPRKQHIKVVIGDAISHQDLHQEQDTSMVSSHLRSKVYELCN